MNFWNSHNDKITRRSNAINERFAWMLQVKIWFQNRRAKERKQIKKQEEQRTREQQLRQQTTAQVVAAAANANVMDATAGGMASYAGGEMGGMLGGLMQANGNGSSSSMAMPMPISQAASHLPSLPAWMSASSSTSAQSSQPIPPQPLSQPSSLSQPTSASLHPSLQPSEIIALNTVLNNPPHSTS